MSKNFLKSSLQNASLNIILQILFRLITFILNAFVIRHVSQNAVGVMYVRLLLLESTVLSLSREAFRKACVSKTVHHRWPQVINLLWLTVPLCIALSAVFSYVWINALEAPDKSVTEYYTFSVLTFAASCIIEMCSEPLYLVSQAFLFVKLRAFADIVQMFVRTLIFVCLILKSAEHAVWAFSIAQIASVSCYVLFFYSYFFYYIYKHKSSSSTSKKKQQQHFPFYTITDFLPKILKEKTQTQIDWKLLILVWSFMKQSVMMQLLTEGERYVMTVMNVLSFSEQGIFDIVNNLGSLAARFIFRPIEESAYFYFSQLIHRDEDIRKQNKTLMDEAAVVLENLLRCVASLGLLVLCFGQGYAQMALYLYGGVNLITGVGPKLLRAHCLAIFIIAINGSTECYALSTMNTSQLNRYNKTMIVFSIGFIFMAWLLSYSFGSVGFILANCFNMAARITYCCRFIQSRYEHTSYKPLSGLIPKLQFLIALIFSSLITIVSETFLFNESLFLHFLIGATCFVITVTIWLFEERQLVRLAVQQWRMKRVA